MCIDISILCKARQKSSGYSLLQILYFMLYRITDINTTPFIETGLEYHILSSLSIGEAMPESDPAFGRRGQAAYRPATTEQKKKRDSIHCHASFLNTGFFRLQVCTGAFIFQRFYNVLGSAYFSLFSRRLRSPSIRRAATSSTCSAISKLSASLLSSIPS